jgi:hypothetical protein
MKRNRISTISASILITVALLAPAVPAAAAQATRHTGLRELGAAAQLVPGLMGKFLGWLDSLWAESGYAIDPNGSPTSSQSLSDAPGTGTTTITAASGYAIDPNG